MIPERLLIIDDDRDSTTLVKFILESDTSWKVSTAVDAQEGMAKVRSQQPDVILLDLAIPKQSGIDIYKMLKSDSSTSNIPVIFVTAIYEIKEAMKSEIAENVEVISKPFDIMNLAARITKVCHNYSSSVC